MQVILDTDPGVDDVIALLWLLALDLRFRADIVGIATTEGNLRRRGTFGNACRILDFCRRSDISLAKSAPHRGKTAEHIHGIDGLAGLRTVLPEPSKPYDNAPRAAVQLDRWINAGTKDTTLITIGPLTNLEAVEVLNSGTLANAQHVIALCGTFKSGNVTPEAEFNAHFNPRALHNVLDARADITLIPLDVTRQLDLNSEHLKAAGFANDTSRIGQFVYRLTQAMERQLKTVSISRFFVHDACAIAYAFYPELFETVSAHVKVDTRLDMPTTGKTTIEKNPIKNASVARRMNAEAVRDQMLSDIKEFARTLR